MDNLSLSTKIIENLFDQGIDTEISITSTPDGVRTTVELSDLATGTPVGVLKGETLEEALAGLYGKFAAHVRDIKTGRIENKLTEL